MSASSTSVLKILALPLILFWIIPYKWLHNEVIGTPQTRFALWIFEPTSIMSILQAKLSLSQFPFFFMFFFCLAIHLARLSSLDSLRITWSMGPPNDCQYASLGHCALGWLDIGCVRSINVIFSFPSYDLVCVHGLAWNICTLGM